MRDTDRLKLENQLCFPIYACSREIIKAYHPYLQKLNLTYTQYIVMMVLWDRSSIGVKELGELLYLDSGTLTPLLKKMEAKGYLQRARSVADERCVLVSLTEAGRLLQQEAVDVPKCMGCKVALDESEAAVLYGLLYKVLAHLQEKK